MSGKLTEEDATIAKQIFDASLASAIKGSISAQKALNQEKTTTQTQSEGKTEKNLQQIKKMGGQGLNAYNSQNEFYDGSESKSGSSVSLGGLKEGTLSGANPPADTKNKTTNYNKTVASTAPPKLTQKDDEKTIPLNCWNASGNAKKVCDIHVAVWEKYREHSLGSGWLMGTVAGGALYDKQVDALAKDCVVGGSVWKKSLHKVGEVLAPVAAPIYSAAASGIKSYDKLSGNTWQKEKLPSTGDTMVADITHDKYMRCYDWQTATTATAKLNGVMTYVQKGNGIIVKGVELPGHSYVVFLSSEEIYISDPWKNGKEVIVVPNTPENREKWTISSH